MKVINYHLAVVLGLILLGLTLRFFSIYPYNIIFGFDQARDFFESYNIFAKGDLRVIGPTAGNNPNLHHGVLYLYYLAVPLALFRGDPQAAALWNAFFNALTIAVLYFFSLSLFSKKKAAFVAGLLAAISYQLIEYSGWLSNPTVTVLTVPCFFYCLWKVSEGSRMAWLGAALFLGVTIQLELFFLYLLPFSALLWLFLKFPRPGFKLGILSLIIFSFTTATMIATEIKFKLAGVLAILNAGKLVGGEASLNNRFISFFERLVDNFSIIPTLPKFSLLVFFVVGSVLITVLVKSDNKKVKRGLLFTLWYLFSPMLMLLMGYHNAPWFLIGIPGAVILLVSFTVSFLPIVPMVSLLIIFFFSNFAMINNTREFGPQLLEPDDSAIIKRQLEAIDFTYQTSNGPFSINTVTNPLYINATWAYHYQWYGKPKYGFYPYWSGGDQLYPYNTLFKATQNEEIVYLIVDTSPRIPPQYLNEAKTSLSTSYDLLLKKEITGLLIQKYRRNNIN